MVEKIDISFEDVYQMIEREELAVKYAENEEGEGQIEIGFSEDGVLEIIENSNLSEILEKIFIIASSAGMIVPSDFYRTIEEFVKSDDFSTDSLKENGII